MRSSLTLLLALTLFAVSVQADQTKEAPSAGGEGAAVLEKAREAMKSLTAVRYKVDYKPTAWLTKRIPVISANVLLAGQSKWKIDRFRFEGTVQPPPPEKSAEGSTEPGKTVGPQKMTAGCDGDMYFLIHEDSKTVYEDIDPAVLGSSGRAIPRAVLSGFTSGDPLADERKAEKIELREPVDVGGEKCDQVVVTMPGGRQTIWYISQKTSLPRRVDRIINDPKDGVATTELVLSEFEANPKVEGKPFKVVVPAGFTKSDQFAP